jgi:uncharacterized protein YjbI with pentapeptide repeats
MTFDPAHPVFTGKLQLQTTNATGQKYDLSYTAKSGLTLPTLTSTRVKDPTTIWTSYDAGSGAVVLASNAGLYVSVQAGNNLAILVSDAAAASPFTLVPGQCAEEVQIAWFDPSSGQTLIGYYQLGTGLQATLSFLGSGGPQLLSALALTTTTAGLAAIQSSKSAAGYDLTGVNLTGADLSGVDCTGAHFDAATLAGTSLSAATLTGASFVGVDLTGIIWGTDISAANADFSNSIGVGMVVASSGDDGKRATFDSATFTGADWAGCDLSNASLHNAFVTGANFCGATLESAYLYALQAGKSNDGTIPGADFSYAYMPDANLQASNLNGANLSHAQIYFLYTGASLLNANLTETDFSRADLSGAQFRRRRAVRGQFRRRHARTLGNRNAGHHGGSLARERDVRHCAVLGRAHERRARRRHGRSGRRRRAAFCHLVRRGRRRGGARSIAAAHSLHRRERRVRRGWLRAVEHGAGERDPGRAVLDVLAAGALEVYASGISLVEQGDGGITYAAAYTITATALPPATLSADTHCPNHVTKATNDARGLSWQAMMTAPRLALAELDLADASRRKGGHRSPRRHRYGGEAEPS